MWWRCLIGDWLGFSTHTNHLKADIIWGDYPFNGINRTLFGLLRCDVVLRSNNQPFFLNIKSGFEHFCYTHRRLGTLNRSYFQAWLFNGQRFPWCDDVNIFIFSTHTNPVKEDIIWGDYILSMVFHYYPMSSSMWSTDYVMLHGQVTIKPFLLNIKLGFELFYRHKRPCTLCKSPIMNEVINIFHFPCNGVVEDTEKVFI